MHLSKPIQSQKANKTVLEYSPKKISIGVPGAAMQVYNHVREQGTDFRMSEVMRVQTGLEEMDNDRFEELVEKKTLERLKEVQEAAYQEAYQLGLEEGKKEAYSQHGAEIEKSLLGLGNLVEALQKIKIELATQNERHLIQIAFHMAHRLAAYEVSVNPEATLSILRQSVEMAQSEEQVTVQVNPEQLLALENFAAKTGRELDFLKKIKFEPNQGVREGGCIVVSNYGEVDSRIETRVEKLWQGLLETLPRAKDKVSIAS